MINYFNYARINNKYLITNDFGNHMLIDESTLNQLITRTIDNCNPFYPELVNKGFVYNCSSEEFILKFKDNIRSMKSYCFTGPSLHIFVVTNVCNLNCIYCQAHSKESELDKWMSVETGKKSVEFAFQSSSSVLTFEFQGGEPLLNFKVIREMIDYSQTLNKTYNKKINYTIVSNLAFMTEEIADYIANHNIAICTSLDGPKEVHDHNRPIKSSNNSSHGVVLEKMRLLESRNIEVGAIQTTTSESLKHPKDIVDEYIRLGIKQIFLRPLTPLGIAEESWDVVGYTAEQFVDFYKAALNHIIDLNLSGTKIVEAHSTFFLKKILGGHSDNYMELRSPCGATMGQMAYHYNGDVFTCDEGRMLYEMGNDSFKLGNVYLNSYEEIINSKSCKSVSLASIIEAVPTCHSCVYQPYCGTCPVVNYASTLDLYSNKSNTYRCKIYKGMLNVYFDMIYNDDSERLSVIKSWIGISNG